jgi:predicted nucleic acid-binding protein
VILLDTSVVSAVRRRRRRGPAEEAIAKKVAALLASDEEVALPGIVFQEILCGVERGQHDKLLAGIRESFLIALATEGDHIMAADLVTQTARRGVALSTPDALIAAQAINRRARLFTTDGDFETLISVAALKLV